MWRASSGWMEKAVDAGILKGSGMALLAYTVLHSYEVLSFIRCRLVCRGQDANHSNQQSPIGTLSNTIEPAHRARTRAMLILLLIVGMSLGVTIAVPSTAPAAEGFWWGSPVNPGFDRNTVIQATGIVSRVDIAARGGPCTLSLQTPTDRITVMLGPSWFLSEQHADIQNGDPLVVEGAKMMDRRGHLHLVAASVTNQRTGAVLRLRDETGRPLWTSGRPSWKR